MASANGPVEQPEERMRDLIAIACSHRYAHATDAADISAVEVYAAATTGTETALIEPNQLGDFLTSHANALLLCHDVAHLHWCMLEVLRRAEHDAGEKALWQFSREYRIDDVMLLEQRVRAIDETSFSLPKSLGKLAAEYLRQPGEDDSPVPQDVAGAAESILALHENLMSRIETIPQYGKFNCGPLGLGVEVQAAIAMEPLKHRGLKLDAQIADRLFETLGEVIQASTLELFPPPRTTKPYVPVNDPDLERCFCRNGKSVIAKDGRLEIRAPQLRKWLEKRLDRLPDASGLPWFRPLDDRRRTSVVPDHWDYWLGSDPLIRTWVELAKAVSMQHWLQAARSELAARTDYGIVPHIGCIRNDIAFAHQEAPGLFRPADGNRFIVVSFPDLELRAWARFQLLQFDGEAFPIRDWLRNGRDVYNATAIELSTTFSRREPDRMFANDPAAVGLANLTEGEWEEVARLLLTAMPRMLSPAQIAELLDRNLPQHNFGETAARKLYYVMADEIHPQLGLFVRPLMPDVLIGQLQADPRALAELLPKDILASDDLYRYLRNVVTGGHDEESLRARFLETIIDDQHRQALAALTPQDLLQLSLERTVSSDSGREWPRES